MAEASFQFIDSCNKSRALFAKYCSEPLPKDPYAKLRWEMAGVHAFMTDAFQNIYQLADKIPPSEEQEFAFFCYCATQSLEHHHHLEETHIFPKLAPEYKTDVIDEHAAFSEGLHEFDSYLLAVMGAEKGEKCGQAISIPSKFKEPYNGTKIKQLLESFAAPLFTHLQHEIGWLDPEILRESGLPLSRLAEIDKLIEEHIKNELDGPSALVFGLYHVPPYCQAPDLPWFVRKVLVPYVLYWKHRKSWRWFPDYSKQPFGPILSH
ncbi:hypothetical protein FRC17_010882 [Serendipita sp. 399]|nr:hypothetical protein FRC17_010882 [Serendipita sp. 399]